EPLAEGLPYRRAEAAWGVTHEMVQTLADLLIRRLKVAFETRDQGRAAAVRAAEVMAPLLGWDARSWSASWRPTPWTPSASSAWIPPTPDVPVPGAGPGASSRCSGPGSRRAPDAGPPTGRSTRALGASRWPGTGWPSGARQPPEQPSFVHA
ncbi:glycerol-3-phosphate dehydrogenase C-terminal domain-containing protein, partial [Corallococcus sp. 4LFB]|uniref:glycerol-3-phosphate dehydrogenase C-terminal domain-containing protein n=1 Tax=Corallococcus sp. 4LFB TaxID=3383249 RepID=UPI003975EA76